jgi:hypothetical protein
VAKAEIRAKRVAQIEDGADRGGDGFGILSASSEFADVVQFELGLQPR